MLGVDGTDGVLGLLGLEGTDGAEGVEGKEGVLGNDGVLGTDGVEGLLGNDSGDGIENSESKSEATDATLDETSPDGVLLGNDTGALTGALRTDASERLGETGTEVGSESRLRIEAR